MTLFENVQKRLQFVTDALSFEREGNYIIIKATKWLATEDYQQINDLIREFNGERVAAGKMSHWRVPDRGRAYLHRLHME